MSLVNGFQGKVNSASNFVKNPLSSRVESPFDGADFPEGMLIEEILSSGATGDRVRLVGNLMPRKKVPFGGTQRLKKTFYSGYSEPSMQVFGPEETDITIDGEFKDKKYSNRDMKGVAFEIAQLLDAIRIRGNVVRIVLGELERYAILQTTKFELEMLTKIPYSITFSVIGFNAPKNAIFLQRNKEYPFAINKELIDAAIAFQDTASQIPDSVPLSIGDLIRNITSDIASVMATVTGFIDSVISAVEDIKSSINRIKGLIKYAQNKVRQYKNTVGGFSAFLDGTPTSLKYSNAKFYSSLISGASFLTRLLARLSAQFSNIANDLPLARHIVRDQDSLQTISVKYYGTSENWKKIYDFNALTTVELTVGKLLNIPRV